MNLQLGAFRLLGVVKPWEGGLFLYRSGTLRAEDGVCAWIRHLAYNAAVEADGCAGTAGSPARFSRFLARDASLTLLPVEDAAARLEALLEIYWTGLSRPISFFPHSALVYVERLERGASERDAVRSALRTWLGSTRSTRTSTR